MAVLTAEDAAAKVQELIDEAKAEGTSVVGLILEAIESGRIKEPPIERPPDAVIRCKRCGGVTDDTFFDDGSGYCRCGGRMRRLLSYLDAVDPERRMTLNYRYPENVNAVNALVAIAKGERTKGVFLTGLPGRGKTHMMIGLGRELLSQDVDCGYYNMVSLVSRVQDTYSDYGGETRRAIIEDVATHEVVLLDDFGKEHRSTNVESIVYELFDALTNASVTLVLSTNLPASALGERYDEAVRSRIKGLCERFVVEGEDRRAVAWEW